jgi:hypothetical protein
MISPTEQPPAQQQIDFVVRLVKRGIKRTSLATAVAAWLAGTLLFLLGFVLLDHWWPGGLSERICTISGFVYLLCSAAWLIVVPGWLATRRLNDLYAAHLIEKANPEMGNTVIDALQLGSREDLASSVREAVVNLVASELEGMPVGTCLSMRRLWRTVYVGGVLLAALFIYSLASPKPVLPSIWRAFGAHRPAPTRTTIISIEPADGASVMRGDPVVFSVTLRGQKPASACVRFSVDGGASWLDGERLELNQPPRAGAGEPWTAIKAGGDIQRSLDWQIVAGDAVSPVRRLVVRAAPTVLDVTTRYEYPRYTRLAATTQPGGDIDALVDTQVTIHARTNVPGRDPILVLGTAPEEKRHAMATASAPADTLEGSLTVQRDEVYHISFADLFGKLNRDVVEYRIRARADEPPRLTVHELTASSEVAPNATLDVHVDAGDDFGLTKALFSWRKGQGGETRGLPLSLGGQAGPPTRATLAEAVAVSQLSVAPGDVIEWWVSVWDNREDAQGRPAWQKTDSAIGTLRISRPADVLARRNETTSTAPSGLATSGTETTGEARADTQPEPSWDSQVAQGSDEAGARQGAGSQPAEASGAPTGSQPSRDEAVKSFADAHERELKILTDNLINQQHEGARPGEGAPKQSTGQKGQGGSKEQGQSEEPKEKQRQTQQQEQQQQETQQGPPKQDDSEQPEQNRRRDGQGAVDGQTGGVTQGKGQRASQQDDQAQGKGQEAGRSKEQSQGESERRDKGAKQEPSNQQKSELTQKQPGEQSKEQRQEQTSEQAQSQPENKTEDNGPTPVQGQEQEQDQEQEQERTPTPRQAQSEQQQGQRRNENQNEGQKTDAPQAGPQGAEQQSQGQRQEQGQQQGQEQQQGQTDQQAQQQEQNQQQGQAQPQTPAEGEGKARAPTQLPGQFKRPARTPGQEDSDGPGRGQGEGSKETDGQGEGQAKSSGEGQGKEPGGNQSQGQREGQAEGTDEGAGNVPGAPGKRTPSNAPVAVPTQPADDGTEPTGTLSQPREKSPPPDSTGNVSKVVDELETALRRNEVDPKLLESLGWNLDSAWRFVKDYRRQADRGQTQREKSQVPSDRETVIARPAPGTVRRSTSGPAQGIRSLGTTHRPGEDKTHQLREAGDQRVPRELDPILRAYYSSLSSQPAR